MSMYKGFQLRYMFAQHIPYMYHRYTIGSMKGRMVHVGYMYGTCPKNIYHAANPLYIGVSAW